MNRVLLTAFAGTIALGGLFASAAYADEHKGRGNDKKEHALACYKVVEHDDYHGRTDRGERLVLDIVFHSYLSHPRDSNKQVAYDVAGKYITKCKRRGGWDMTAADGTLITSDNDDYAYRDAEIDKGARLGVEAMGVLRGCKNVKFDCTTKQDEIAPDYFRCKVHTEDQGVRKVRLIKEDKVDGNCRIFRDREDYLD